MLEQFDYMYNNSWSLDSVFDKTSEEFIAFSSKKGMPVKIFQIPDLIDYVPIVKEYYKQIRNANTLYVIPCDSFDSNEPLGYILRGVTEKEYICAFYKPDKGPSFQPSFGWYDFGNFTYNKPIIITEGVKDALFIKQYYPYTIASLSCKLSESFCRFIASLTTNVLIAFDADTAGENAFKSAAKKFGAVGVNVKRFAPQGGCKDFGEYFKKDLDNSMKFALNMLLSTTK